MGSSTGVWFSTGSVVSTTTRFKYRVLHHSSEEANVSREEVPRTSSVE